MLVSLKNIYSNKLVLYYVNQGEGAAISIAPGQQVSFHMDKIADQMEVLRCRGILEYSEQPTQEPVTSDQIEAPTTALKDAVSKDTGDDSSEDVPMAKKTTRKKTLRSLHKSKESSHESGE